MEAARARVMAMAVAAAAQQEGEDDGMAKIVAELVCVYEATRDG